MKKAEGIRWSSLEGEDEVKAKPIPKQGQSCWYKNFKLVIIVTSKMAQTDRYFKKWSAILEISYGFTVKSEKAWMQEIF